MNFPASVDRDSNGKRAGSKADPIRVLIVDDSLTVRTVFSRMVVDADDMEVVAGERSAELAIARLKKEPVDVILLDLEMPGMGGLKALPELLATQPEASVLVVSSLTDEGAEHTLAALSMGAADTMLKPRPGGFDATYRAALLDKIRALGGRDDAVQKKGAAAAPKAKSAKTRRSDLVAIGASTGGIHSLNILLRNLPPEFKLPICITQHLPASFVAVFARQLEVTSARKTVIAEDGTLIRPGEIAVATGHAHMIIEPRGSEFVARISTEHATSGCMPSVDPMLTSLAQNCKGRATAVILSGMGRDGLAGSRDLVDAGGQVLVQDAETSAVWGMPGAVAMLAWQALSFPPKTLQSGSSPIAGSHNGSQPGLLSDHCGLARIAHRPTAYGEPALAHRNRPGGPVPRAGHREYRPAGLHAGSTGTVLARGRRDRSVA